MNKLTLTNGQELDLTLTADTRVTLRAVGGGAEREVYIIFEDGKLTFNDERYPLHPSGPECIEMTPYGWKTPQWSRLFATGIGLPTIFAHLSQGDLSPLSGYVFVGVAIEPEKKKGGGD